MPMRREPTLFDFYADNLEMLAETIGETLGRPVTIEDANHRLVAYSSHAPDTDPARLATIVGRRVPDQVISSLWHGGVIRRLLESEKPVRIAAIPDVGLSERVAVAIRSNAAVIGFIWVLQAGKPFTDEEMSLLEAAASAARNKLVQWPLQRHKEEAAHKDFFWQLLTGHIRTEAHIREKAQSIGIVLPALFHIAVLEFTSAIQERQQQQALENFASSAAHCRIVLCVSDKNQLILLSAPTVHKTKAAIGRQLELADGNLRARFGARYAGLASGNLYEEYGRLETSYREALLLLQVKRRLPEETSRLHYYSDLGFYRYLPLIWEEAGKHSFENESLVRLRAYDREHHGELVHSLEVFLAHDSNVKAAADALHVHANTLNYRLKRIGEIGGIDLTDMEQKVTLYLDFKTEKFGGGRDL
ncbi:hypothetical protein BK140_18580 [Paenibacillus macerans]|nr:hypothetical protein BK140_18580 [Paenibacillus macerans]